MNNNQVTATISEASPRAEVWRAIYGRLHDIPLQSPFATPLDLPEVGKALCYMLDLNAITADERQRLIGHLASRFNLPREQVESDIGQAGVPILAKEVIITVPPALSFSMMDDEDKEEENWLDRMLDEEDDEDW